MLNLESYGVHRVLEPKNVLPQPSWKLDNSMKVFESELLIDVKYLNIDFESFNQIYLECRGNIDRIKNKIFQIIELRGKLHNPITGTGGVLFGTVREIGKLYPNYNNIHLGDEIISLNSLSLIPIKIKEIKHIDISTAQIEVCGQAILFSNSPLIKIDSRDNFKILMSVLDEAGAAMQSWKLANPKDKVLIVGAGCKLGLLCMFAVREKLKGCGKLVGLVNCSEIENILSKYNIYDELYSFDNLKPFKILNKLKIGEENLFDLTINCINMSGTEALSVLCTKNKGKIFFSSLSNNYKTASSTTEGIGKDLDIYIYKGYAEGHAEFTINLLRKNIELKELLSESPKVNLKKNLREKEFSGRLNVQSNILKGINMEHYVFESNKIRNALNNALKVANYECTVLITGESGVGKEVFAQVIHENSNRNKSSLIKINCGSIPENLLESELFGYEKGAFTGANKDGKVGFFEIASQGTLFLDEIGEFPLNLQVKLLRVLQEGEIYRIGGTIPIKVNTRIIAATNKDLSEMVRQHRFRKDLFYRINVFPVNVPPLRDRKDDVIPLVKYFIEKYNKKYNLNKRFSIQAMNCLTEYEWPGNIRELDNLIQRLFITVDESEITIVNVLNNLETNSILEDNDYYIEKNTISYHIIMEKTEYRLLKYAKEKYKTTRKTAEALGLSHSSLIRRLKKYNI